MATEELHLFMIPSSNVYVQLHVGKKIAEEDLKSVKLQRTLFYLTKEVKLIYTGNTVEKLVKTVCGPDYTQFIYSSNSWHFGDYVQHC